MLLKYLVYSTFEVRERSKGYAVIKQIKNIN
jgi:hypothetical protein